MKRQIALAKHIAANIQGLELGKSLFINEMPSTCLTGVLLKEGYAGATIDGEVGGLRKTRFQCVARGRNMSECQGLCDKIYQLFESPYEFTVDQVSVRSIRPTTEPIPYPSSPGDNVELAMNFSVVYVIVSQ